MNLYREAGELLLGSRLKRTGDRYLNEISRVYRSLDIDFDPSWFPVFFLLDKKHALTISGFAGELQISQSGATQMILSLEKRGLLEEFHPADRDRRTKYVRFTGKGEELLEKVRPVWNALNRAMSSLLSESPDGSRLLPALAELENSFGRKALGDRVLAELEKQQRIGTFMLTPWSIEYDQSYREILLERLSAGLTAYRAETETLLKDPGGDHSGELLLLRTAEEVLGFAVIERKEPPEISVPTLRSSWSHSGAESAFIDLLEKNTETDPDLKIETTGSAFIAAASDTGYRYYEWTGDIITLRRQK